ncbi:MAG: nicotinamide mononucleotide transporter family protein [Bifidobacteriaceae bacterium]|jgi:nicotinamide riboside transporter PnuC|nr:nicotinamide mononucleotide transporter family protein [Bifidobacteriaceae bacterium]
MRFATKLFTSRIWDYLWLYIGIILILFFSIIDFTTWNVLWFTSTIGSVLGLVIVQAMANLKGKFGSALGVLGAVLDGFNNYNYGIMAQVLLVIYTGFTYIVGFFTLQKRIKVSQTNISNLIVSLTVGLIGIMILYFFGTGLLPANTPIYVFAITVLSFIIQVVAQYLMIKGKSLSWFLWTAANILNIFVYGELYFLKLEPMAIFYLIMTIMYLLNSIKAIFVWYSESEKLHYSV